MFSSCARLADISITKRHYRSGYFVDLGSSKPVQPKVREKLSSLPPVKTAAGTIHKDVKSSRQENNVFTTSNEIPVPAPVSEKKKKQNVPAAINYYAGTNSNYVKPEKITEEYTFVPYSTSADETSDEANRNSSSAPFWVIILFCILIPPIGVALKFGIVDKFWICLLLTLLFWLPGAIYALIVVTE